MPIHQINQHPTQHQPTQHKKKLFSKETPNQSSFSKKPHATNKSKKKVLSFTSKISKITSQKNAFKKKHQNCNIIKNAQVNRILQN